MEILPSRRSSLSVFRIVGSGLSADEDAAASDSSRLVDGFPRPRSRSVLKMMGSGALEENVDGVDGPPRLNLLEHLVEPTEAPHDVSGLACDLDERSDSEETQKAFSLSDWREVNDPDEIDLEETVVIEEDEVARESHNCQEVVEVCDTQHIVSESQHQRLADHQDKSCASLTIQIDDSERQEKESVTLHEIDIAADEPDTEPGAVGSPCQIQEANEAPAELSNDAADPSRQPGHERAVNALADTFPETVEQAPLRFERAEDDAFTSEFKRRRLFYMELERKRCML